MVQRFDSRIRLMIDKGVDVEQRSLFVVIGDQGKDQVCVVLC